MTVHRVSPYNNAWVKELFKDRILESIFLMFCRRVYLLYVKLWQWRRKYISIFAVTANRVQRILKIMTTLCLRRCLLKILLGQGLINSKIRFFIRQEGESWIFASNLFHLIAVEGKYLFLKKLWLSFV